MKKTNRILIAILLVVMALAAAMTATFAVFINQAYKKGVISTEALDICFASNYLELSVNASVDPPPAFSDYNTQTLIFTKSSDENAVTSFDFTVQNYLVESAPNQNTIRYKLTVILKSQDGTTWGTLDNYSISKVVDKTVSTPIKLFSQTSHSWTSPTEYVLSGGYANTDTFRLTFPQNALDKVSMLIIAQPTTDCLAYTNDKMLACVIAPCTESNVKAFAIDHNFVDSGMEGARPCDLDAFNYEVSINTGKANITLTWNTDYVTIDPFFKDRVNGTLAADGGSITFEMDSDETPSLLVQFYRTQGKDSSEAWQASWSAMENVIGVSGTPIDVDTTNQGRR